MRQTHDIWEMTRRDRHTRQHIIDTLLSHRDQLTAQGVEHVDIFGSVARDEDGPSSDVDLCIHMKDSARQKGFRQITLVEDLRDWLTKLLGRHVDLVVFPIYRESLRERISEESVRAF